VCTWGDGRAGAGRSAGGWLPCPHRAAPRARPGARDRSDGGHVPPRSSGPAIGNRETHGPPLPLRYVVGGAEVYTLSRDVQFSGTYTGNARAHQTIAIREDGSALLHISMRFTGTACGKPATLKLQVVGRGNLFEGELTGRYVVFDGGRASRSTAIFRGLASSKRLATRLAARRAPLPVRGPRGSREEPGTRDMGRATACHAECRGFESHQPLPKGLHLQVFFALAVG
jgi:hypothetical protein